MLWKPLFFGFLLLLTTCQAQDEPPADPPAAVDTPAVVDPPAAPPAADPASPPSGDPVPPPPSGDPAPPGDAAGPGAAPAGDAVTVEPTGDTTVPTTAAGEPTADGVTVAGAAPGAAANPDAGATPKTELSDGTETTKSEGVTGGGLIPPVPLPGGEAGANAGAETSETTTTLPTTTATALPGPNKPQKTELGPVPPPGTVTDRPAYEAPLYQTPITVGPVPVIDGGAVGSGDPWYSKTAAFFWNYGLLMFGILLLIIILIGMFYACCFMKTDPAPTSSARHEDIEALPAISVSKPTTQVTQTAKYVDEPNTTSHTYSYRETKQTVTSAGNFPSTPNNSFAVAPGSTRFDGVEGVSSLENKNFKGPASRSTPPASDVGYKFIAPRHLDGTPITHNVTPPPVYDRRLDFPNEPNRVSSRDVITAARVASAVTSVAAAAPPKARPENGEQGTTLERERPGLRGASLERSTSPRPFSPTHKTILFHQPEANRDPTDPASPDESRMSYSEYIGQLREEPSDFAQYALERKKPIPRYPDEENIESQV